MPLSRNKLLRHAVGLGDLGNTWVTVDAGIKNKKQAARGMLNEVTFQNEANEV